MKYRYIGKVEYNQQKLTVLAITAFFGVLACAWVFYRITLNDTDDLWMPFVVLLLGGNLYIDLYLSERVSYAELTHKGFVVVKGHLYGLIKVEKHYTPNMEVIEEFLQELRDTNETFSFLCLDQQVNASVTFYNKNLNEGLLMKKDIEEYFDDGFPDGVFAIPRNPNKPRVKVRALHDYCKEKGVKPEDLTPQELEQFLERK